MGLGRGIGWNPILQRSLARDSLSSTDARASVSATGGSLVSGLAVTPLLAVLVAGTASPCTHVTRSSSRRAGLRSRRAWVSSGSPTVGSARALPALPPSQSSRSWWPRPVRSPRTGAPPLVSSAPSSGDHSSIVVLPRALDRRSRTTRPSCARSSLAVATPSPSSSPVIRLSVVAALGRLSPAVRPARDRPAGAGSSCSAGSGRSERSRAAGHRSAPSGHSQHSGRRASQIRRPCQMRRCGNLPSLRAAPPSADHARS